MKKLFTLLIFALLAITSAWAETLTYTYGDLTGWSISDYQDESSYYLIPKDGSTSTQSDVVLTGIFANKTITSDVKVTLNVATYGNGTNPSASTFSLYADASGTKSVPSTQSGTLPTKSNYTNAIYTVTQANASSLNSDLMIRITKPGKRIRLKSITVEFTYDDTETKTISSLVLSGEPTQTEYYTNQSFNTDDLTVTANYTDGTNADVTSQSTFECNPATFTTAGTQDVKVKAKYKDTYSEEKTYSVTVSEAPVYTLVTDVSQLAVGDKIVLANQSSGMVLSTTQNTKNRKATNEGVNFLDTEKNTLSVTSDQVEIITFEAGTTSGTFAFKVTDGYLYAAGSSSNNYLKTQTTKDANGSAKISIDSSTGAASIVFQGTSTNNVLRYNSSGLFACYGSASQSPVYIYRTGETRKTLSFGELHGQTITKYIGEDDFEVPLTMNPEVANAEITYTSSNPDIIPWYYDNLSYGQNNMVSIKEKEQQPGKATLTASYEGYEPASFTVDLKKLPDPTFSVEDGTYVEKGSIVHLYVPSTPAYCKIVYAINGGAETESSSSVSIPIDATTKIYAFTVCTINGAQVTSEGLTKTYYAKELSSIAISGTPTKTTYISGEAFSTDGLKVTATYNDNSTEDVTSSATLDIDPKTFSTEGSQNVTVTATYNGKTATQNYTVTVSIPTTTTYTLVNSTDGLVSGAQYVLVETDGTRAASSYGTSQFSTVAKGASSYTIDGDEVTVIGDVAIFTLTADGEQWKISDETRNFGCKSDGANISATGNSSFYITFNTDNTINIQLSANASRNWMYNTDGNAIKYYATSTNTAKNLKLYKSNAQVVVKPAVPTFDPVSGTTFTDESATVTITAAEGCTLKYTLGDGEEQTVDNNTAVVTVTPTAYTIKAKSVNAEGVESVEATATYKFNVVAHVKNIAEFMALEENTTAIFDNPVIVLYDYSQPSTKTDETTGEYSNPEYIWVKDETGHTNIYFEVAVDPTNHQAKYENGDVIPAGFVAVKSYYTVGKYTQAKVETENNKTFEKASLKRLADPVTITFDEFNALQVGSDADIAKWNNTYVMIPKVTMAADETDTRGKTYNVSHNGVAATNNVFYNKYSDLRDGEYALTKQGEDARVTMPTSSTTEYNVYGILQRYDQFWEIMPIRFVEYSAQTVTLKELVAMGNKGETDKDTEYTILNDLRGVVALPGNVILAKDENGNAVGKVTPTGKSFMINAKSYFSDDTESVNAKAQEDYDQSNWVEIELPSGVSASDYVDKIITGLSVKGRYTDPVNPRLVASEVPAKGGQTGAYTRNAMCPANFMGTSQKCNSEENHGEYFFMTPKPNECVQVVWAIYNSIDGNFYIPAKEGSINTHAFKGGFGIGWTYNKVSETSFGEPTGLQDGNLYQFKAVVKKSVPGSTKAGKRNIAYDHTQDISGNYLIYPLDLTSGSLVTGITNVSGAKTVKSVRYFNAMGMQLAEPAPGINIVVTTYTDGTATSQKVLK